MEQMYRVGSAERPLRVALIGAGPSSFYAAEALLSQPDLKVQVDMFDRLPTPFGLVRGGVAPDHQKIKSVIRVYERTSTLPGFRFFGHVWFGRDVVLEDLQRYYDQIVFAVGSESDRRLGIPGEDLEGVHGASAFVGWYNGHPDHRHLEFDLSRPRVAVVGVGNVAMDVARILAQKTERLAPTDIACHALDQLRSSRIEEIYVLGRRGVAQAAFSPAEIKEIGSLEGVDLVVSPEDIAVDAVSEPDLADQAARKNLEYLQARASEGPQGNPRRVTLRFLVSPVEILGAEGRVTGLKVEHNVLERDAQGNVKARGTGQLEVLPVDLVFRSVGYFGVQLPGVPFDRSKGILPNALGRVIDPETHTPLPGLYVVGWAKRGPSGLIGTNKGDSVATVRAMLEDIAGQEAPLTLERTPEAALQFLLERQPHLVTLDHWRHLDRAEIEQGAALGKIREKFTHIPDMLHTIRTRRDSGAS